MVCLALSVRATLENLREGWKNILMGQFFLHTLNISTVVEAITSLKPKQPNTAPRCSVRSTNFVPRAG